MFPRFPDVFMKIVTKQGPLYRDWKKQVPALKADAIQFGTEGGPDILLYWTGRDWDLFWPEHEG